MKKSLLMVALAATLATGCAKPSESVEHAPYYGIHLKLSSDIYSSHDLEYEYEFQAVEKYGKVAFKAIYWCDAKYSNVLKNIDLSSDVGGVAIDEYNYKMELCVTQTLDAQATPLPEKLRKKIERPNVGLELNESEIESFNEPPVAQYDKESPRYKEVLEACAVNNNSIVDDQEFVEAVDFCVAKGM